MSQPEKWIGQAIRLAIENAVEGRGGPFGAVVVRNGQLLASGRNLVVENNDPTAHAEVMAIREACKALGFFELHGCDLYTSCEPCPMCLGAIYWARPDHVYYAASKDDAAAAGFDDSFIYDQFSIPNEARTIPMIRVALPEKLEPFERWKASPLRQPY
jgi:guanine deaminase